MTREQENLREEQAYLARVLGALQRQLAEEDARVAGQEEQLLEARRDMWENADHSASDFTRLTETVQHLEHLRNQTLALTDRQRQARLLRQMQDAPYFARLDFEADGGPARRLYIGIASLVDDDGLTRLVYDWRSPIASLFYRYELGPAGYDAPAGRVNGRITLKRQFEIQGGALLYYFDCNQNVWDEALREALSQHASSRMKAIVETIQREQDVIIRNAEHDLVQVEGVAGSGKTSVALHRVAFLMYQELSNPLSAGDIRILSPNTLFSDYISGVLPDLGERNVQPLTLEQLLDAVYPHRIPHDRRSVTLERLATLPPGRERDLARQDLAFKTSAAMRTLLDRLLALYERRLPLHDVTVGAVTVLTREELLGFVRNNRAGLTLGGRLQALESVILEAARPYRRRRIDRLRALLREKAIDDAAVLSRLAAQEAQRFLDGVRALTRVSALTVYRRLYEDPALFRAAARGLELPEDLPEIARRTAEDLAHGRLPYADSLAVLYLESRLHRHNALLSVRQVVVDESQDYGDLVWATLYGLYPNARYTLLGDPHQALTQPQSPDLARRIPTLLHKPHALRVSLRQGFRSSYEITAFANRFLPPEQAVAAFDRHEAAPLARRFATAEQLHQAIRRQVLAWQEEGMVSIALLCKSQAACQALEAALRPRLAPRRLHDSAGEGLSGVLLLPVYESKGLEFDAVLVCDADARRYGCAEDLPWLYVACTRALHRLSLFGVGKLSPYLQDTTGKVAKNVPTDL